MLFCKFQKDLRTADGLHHLKMEISIEEGQIFALFGPSGVGKTVTLQIIAGLESVKSGRIRWKNDLWLDSNKGKIASPENRDLAIVFQTPVLFPNMTVLGNLLFAAKSRSTIDEIEKIMQLAGIEGLADRYPQDLSGGQRQRVVISRALLRKSQLLLLDEPFSALDITARYQLYALIRQHHAHYRPTIVLVSHLPGDIFALADRVAIMEGHGVTATGPPFDLLIQQNNNSALEIEGEILQIQGQVATVAFANDIRRIQFTDQQLKLLKPGDKCWFAVGDLQPVIR